DSGPIPAEKPTVLASLGTAPRMPEPPQRTAVVGSAQAMPVPAPRPRDLGDMTASLGNGTRALGYAAAPERDLPRFGPIPGTHTKIMELPDRVRQPQTMHAAYGDADAARAPVDLYS